MIFKVWIIFVTNFILLNNFQYADFAQENSLKYCLVDDTLPHEMVSTTKCPLLMDSEQTDIECIIAVNRVTCLRHLINNEVDFIVAEPEDLMILGTLKNDNNELLVTYKIGNRNTELDKKMVVVVDKSIKDIWHTEQKRFCSPGFEPGVYTRDYVKFFESRIIARKCDPEKTLLENRMATLSEYFKSACISGPWTSDYQYNGKLKKKYANLCAQCENATACSSKDNFFGKKGAVRCLTSEHGDVTWATLDTVHHYFTEIEDKNQYSFLCPDGKKISLTDEPCIWLEEPPQTIVVRRNKSERLKDFIQSPKNEASVWGLFVGQPSNIELSTTPLDYLQRNYPEYYSLKDHAKCSPDRSIKWCVTTNLEAEKCKWLSFAAEYHGLEPLIKCVQEKSSKKCIESVKSGANDIFSVEPHEEEEAKKKGLKVIVSMLSDDESEYNIVAVVNKFDKFNSLIELKNHKACFSGYRDLGWNAFTSMMKNLTGDNDWILKDKEMVSKYFSKVCVTNLPRQDGFEKDFPKNLYSLCSHGTPVKRSKSPETEKILSRQSRITPAIIEKFEMTYKEETAILDKASLNCLIYNNADVTFVNLSSLMKTFPGQIGTNFKVLHLNEAKMNCNNKDQCRFSQKSLGSIMIKEDVPEEREDEIFLMLMDIDRLFGNYYQVRSKLFSLYRPFDGIYDLIFPENTQYLDHEICGSSCKQTYHAILSNSPSPNKAVPLMKEVCLAMVLIFFSILLLAFKVL